jgi:hypothetical protein
MDRGIRHQLLPMIAALALPALVAAAPVKKPTPAANAPGVQNCAAHSFEMTIQLLGPDSKPRSSKVKMCGTEGQSDADWIHTLQDAVKKTSLSAEMPLAAKEQIIAAVNAEIERLSRPSLSLPGGVDISKLPKANAPRTTDAAPMSRDFGALPPLPTASNVAPPNLLGPGGALGVPPPRLTLRCALAGDEDRPSDCDTIDKDTILVLQADEAFPRGVEMRFARHGDQRAELDLPALRQGQTAKLRLPKAVCNGVVRSKVEIQALGAGSPTGTVAGRIGEYDLRC